MSSSATPATGGGFFRRLSLTHWIFISMVLGVIVGVAFPDAVPGQPAPVFQAASLKILSTIFLRMIKLLIVPLIFSTLVVGIAGHGDDMKRVGKLALRSIIYFEIVTTLALAIGLAAVNLIRPGDGVNIAGASATVGNDLAQKHVTLIGVIEHVVPQSFFEAAANNEVLQIVFFSVLFGVALARTSKEKKLTMLAFCESLSEIMFKLTDLVMKFAPFGIGAAIAVTVGTSGIGVLKHLGALILTLYAALIVFILLVLVPVALIARIPLRKFWRAVKEPWLIAFSTASSEAALPRAFEAMEAFGVPRRIVAFVLPTGYSFNLDGSTLYLAV
ncbi:MAG TPA: dicarboxylate/amino acid:cation symporter, partial [Gemmatimonadaceae bacterium]|nr:dicarboxylate/amino acid:cation symporter [Gemmatimonadaceae bacterium]